MALKFFKKQKNDAGETRKTQVGEINLKEGVRKIWEDPKRRKSMVGKVKKLFKPKIKPKKPDKRNYKTPVGIDIAGLLSKIRGRKSATMSKYKQKLRK